MKIIKAVIKDKKKMFNLRLNDAEKKIIQSKADKYCGGNLSVYIRYVCLNYKANKDELVRVKN